MSHKGVNLWLALLLLGALLSASGGMVLMRQEAASGSGATTVRAGSDIGLPPGGTTTVAVEVLGAPEPGVGAITTNIVYDPAVIRPSAWTPEPGWSSVLCNLALTPSSARCSAVSVVGLSGDSALASITFQAVGSAGQCSALETQVVTLADPNGNAMPTTAENGQICISAGPPPATPTPTPPGPEPQLTPTSSPPSARSPAAPATPAATIKLVRGCNPVVSTWPDETGPLVIVSSTDPTSAVMAVWKFDQQQAIWLGFSPAAPPSVNDIINIRFLDAVFVCTDSSALLTRPEV